MVRTSSGLFLEVLTARPQAGVPLAVAVFDGANPGTMLAELQDASGITFQDVLSDVGSGSFRLAVADPKATTANIREGNLVKVRLNDVDIFPFWIESPKLVISESGKSEWQLGGSGGLQVLAQAVAYPPGWPTPTGTERVWTTATAGSILRTLIDEAQARGALPHITYDFDATVDSQNNPWPADLELTTHAGTTVLDVAKQLAALGITILMTPQLVFRAFVSGTFGRDLSSSVVWRYGRHIAGDVTRIGIRSVLQNAELVEGAGGKFIEINDPTSIADAYTGRREGGLSFTSSADPTTLQNAGQAQMAITQADAAAISVPLNHGIGNGLFTPYTDYQPGDWVSLDIPGQYAMTKFQLKALTLEQTDADDYTTKADLNAVALDYLVRLRNMLSSQAGSSSGASGGASGSLGLGAPPPSGTPLSANTPAASAPGDTGAVGVGSGAAHDDHRHGREAWALAGDVGAETFGASAAAGASGKVVDAGHVHPMPAAPSGAPTTADYLVGTAQAGLSAEIVVGPTPGGELGGTWPSPTVDATHSGSTHAAAQAAAESTAAGALSSHAGAADPHTGYQKESEKGAASGYAGLGAGGLVPIAQLASGTPDGTKYIRDDGTLVTPAGGGGVSGVTFPITVVFDGGTAAITGNPEVDVTVPANGTITGWTLLADASGNAVVDIWKDVYANYPPTVIDTITAAALPTLSSAAKATDSTLTGWTKTLTAGDVLRFHLNSSATVKRLALTLTYTRS